MSIKTIIINPKSKYVVKSKDSEPVISNILEWEKRRYPDTFGDTKNCIFFEFPTYFGRDNANNT